MQIIEQKSRVSSVYNRRHRYIHEIEQVEVFESEGEDLPGDEE